jgi:GMC oxidoreductase
VMSGERKSGRGKFVPQCRSLVSIRLANLIRPSRIQTRKTVAMVFGRSYPSYRIENVAAKCEKHGIEASPPLRLPQYDVVIIGGCFPLLNCPLIAGGTAGCVLAKRLSTSKLLNILLLERGQCADTFQSRAPLLSIAYARNDDGVVKYPSTPQKNLSERRQMQMISGKLLGGTSRVNNGLYTRCLPGEFADWGEGWDAQSAATMYDRSEGNKELKGEWKTRILEPFFESSKLYPTL